MELAFNELSLSITGHSAQASIMYDKFFGACFAIEKKLKTKVAIAYSHAPHEYVMHEQLTFHSWFEQQEKDRRRSILSMLTKTPIIHDYPYYKIGTLQGMGLGYADENESVLISFASDNNWEKPILAIKKIWINDEDEFEESDISIENIFDLQSADDHSDLMANRLAALRKGAIQGITSGQELWAKKEAVFPNLIFCESLKKDLIYIPGGKKIHTLLKRLLEFENYFAAWKKGDFDPKALSGEVRLESDTRINKLTDQLSFNCPDGEKRLFSLHCDYGVWGERLHFFPDPNSRQCYIGYIGKKIGA